MADEHGQDTQGAAQQQPIQLMINAQYVKDLSFENPNAPRSMMNQTQPQLQMQFDVGMKAVEEDTHEVALTVNVEAKVEDSTLFICELTYCGIFTIKGLSKEQTTQVLAIEGPRMLFPFARAVIADATRDGGFAPFLMQPIDFAALYQQQMQQRAAAQQGMVAGNA